MREWADVATLAKAKNMEGGFVVRGAAGLPFLLEGGMEVAFVPPVLDAPRRAHVAEAVQQGDAFYVTFDEVADRSTAELLAGCHCLVRRADLPEGALAAGSRGLVGWTVRDASGFSGTITAVIENPGQMLLELASEDGGTALLPLVDDFIDGIDKDARIIDVDAPAGLFDLQ